MNAIKYRHEQKIEISYGDLLALRSRLQAVMKPDSHAKDGRYIIRSLYFDDDKNKALREKLDGVNKREKFRLRCYNGDMDFIRLEKKSKINGLCNKQSVRLTTAQVEALLAGKAPVVATGTREADLGKAPNATDGEGTVPSAQATDTGLTAPLTREFISKMRSQGLKPKTLVEYTREAYVFAPGNVRVTLDYNLRTGLDGTDFLNPDCVMVPARDAPAILEVKWDEYLPDIIRDLVQLSGRHAAAFSKYAACRIYG